MFVLCGRGENRRRFRLGARSESGVNINASESGVSINANPGSSSLPSFLPSFPAPFLSSFLAILGHSSLFIIYKLCDKKRRENYFLRLKGFKLSD